MWQYAATGAVDLSGREPAQAAPVDDQADQDRIDRSP